MSLPRYPEYKDSGVEWLGEVPGHWGVAPLKRNFQIVGGSTPKSEQEAYWDGEIVWVTPSDLSKLSSIGISDSQRKITSEGLASCGSTLVPSDSIVLSTRAPIGSVAIAETELCTNQGCKSLVPLADTQSRFYAYLLSISTGELNIRGKGTTFLELSGDELGAFKVGVPPRAEQQIIATFLDRETAKIDALIAEQERLVELLAEKRQAVISHAVIKGLNPNARMKDSGIEWLGEVPEHWVIGALKHFVKSIPGAIKTGPFGSHLTSAEMQAGTVKVFNQRNVIDNDFEGGDNYISEEKFSALATFEAYPGDLLVTTRGTIGRAAILPPDVDQGILHPCLLRVQPDQTKLITEYLLALVQDSDLLKTQIGLMSNATTIEVIYSETMANLILPLPPIQEQKVILAFLDTEIAKFDTLTVEANRAIVLLLERRSALISAAVTGKIDVRTIVSSSQAGEGKALEAA